MNTQMLSRAEAAFKKEQKANEASAAWRDYQALQAAVDANMKRLRALRLAREVTAAPKKHAARHA
jgi:putative IMPACT (imprinted ancient) family translation regulator